ncbi:MAG: ribosome biogenesis GTP-binding protein YihA/YsxC [Elusimicrobia bacterium]|nr:ribosome biogenesis GTP-binding protein YihA/YsxC [Candidatus Liberimonas magnetica]
MNRNKKQNEKEWECGTMNGNIFNSAQFILSVDSTQKLGIADAEVAFAGRSNVGKSSMLNALCGRRKLVKVSKTPGKTRRINVFSVVHGKWLVDLPGYGFAAVPAEDKGRWQHMIEYYIAGRPNLKTVFVIVDAFTGTTKLDRDMLYWLNSLGMPYRVIANKLDRISKPMLEEQKQKLSEQLEISKESIIWASAKKGTGIEELRTAVSKVLKLQ